ncbi:hypothetical protein [Sporomusa termitida]|uniref:CobQ/CobB/MinD/ParA nucleotide binding domain-containing protein n=1 Tax=Sporomusa termitida TaxID=2377 RepID=A0A517DTZ9_9FIRM|nr:hypothetical protein [Sporomusa termitida]QDR80788.1 hypothetical protein SPTER_21230 [Sporomusa termitida]
MEDNRLTIFVGEFGSGKTEIAVNYALQLQQAGQETAIVDMDLVKPYFRTRENRELLEKNGVKVIAPDPRLSHADLPIMPHNLIEIFAQTTTRVVMDAGGGESAIALGQLKRYFDQISYQALLVVNTRRPFTGTAAGIMSTLRRIEQVSRLTISGLVSNTNLGAETTAAHVHAGLPIIEQAAAALDLPVKWVVVPAWLAPSVHSSRPLFILKPYTHYPWMD